MSASPQPATASQEEVFSSPGLQRGLRLFGKLPPFTRRQWRVFGIAATAGFFDNYDRALLSLALKQIQKGLGIAEANLGALLSTIRLGYLFSLLITPWADVIGRRRLLLYTIFGYTAFTGLSAVAPGQASFATCQIFARAFAGAEATVALVILIEEVDAGVRGWAVGYLGSLVLVGYGLAAIAFGFVNVIPFGWRGLYAIALVPLFLIMPLRRALPESRRFERETRAGGRPTTILQPMLALLRSHPGRLSMILSVVFVMNLGGNASGTFLPKYLQEAHRWRPANVSMLFLFGGALGILGNIVAGRVSDRIGRRTIGGLFTLLSAVMVLWVFTTRSNLVIPAWILQVFFSTASDTLINAFGTEIFPTSHRSTAGSAMVVSGTIGGALGLFLEGVLYAATGSHWTAVRLLVLFSLIAPIIIFVFFPETAGRELEDISPDIMPASACD